MNRNDNPMLVEHGPRKVTKHTFCRSCNDLRPIVIPRKPLLWMCRKCAGVPWERDYYACSKWEPRDDVGKKTARIYEITCPRCGAVRNITEWSLKVPRWKSGYSEICHNCKMRDENKKRNKKVRQKVRQKGVVEINGCRVKAGRTDTRSVICDGCVNYEGCLDHIAKHTSWDGWVAERIGNERTRLHP